MKINKIPRIILVLILVFGCFFKTNKAQAISLSTNISEKYTEIEAGERLYFEIDVKYPENPKRKDLRLTYTVEKDGVKIAESNVLKAVETQSQFMDFIIIPESSDSGLYTLKVDISDYEQLAAEVSTTFKVIGGKSQQLQVYFFILLGVISLVAVLIVVNIIMTKRKKNIKKV